MTSAADLSAGRSSKNDWTLLYHTILVGVAALIPFPFLDDVMVGYFRRRLIWQLAKDHGRQLSPQEVRLLGQEQGLGCTSGCLMVAAYVFQEIIQTFLPWLKWQRSADRATEAYYSGYLWDLLLGNAGFVAQHAAGYGKAVQRAREGTNTALVKNLIRGTFRSSRGLVLDIARSLGRFWGYYIRRSLHLVRRVVRPRRSRLDEYIEEQQPHITALAGEVAANLMSRLGEVPQAHFDRLRERFEQELRREGLSLG
jgi:uncharacterized protein (DUF697 family)